MSDRYTIVTLVGRPVAVVSDGEAEIITALDEQSAQTAAAMCLFALEVQAGRLDPPYTDQRALAYARLAERERTAARRP
jgi:hypothetical protein